MKDKKLLYESFILYRQRNGFLLKCSGGSTYPPWGATSVQNIGTLTVVSRLGRDFIRYSFIWNFYDIKDKTLRISITWEMSAPFITKYRDIEICQIWIPG